MSKEVKTTTKWTKKYETIPVYLVLVDDNDYIGIYSDRKKALESVAFFEPGYGENFSIWKTWINSDTMVKIYPTSKSVPLERATNR